MSKSKLIERVLAIELNMFLGMPTDNPQECQDNKESFKMMRRCMFETWSESTLESYLDDLFEALKKGDNLMTLKYARMENLIPVINKNPIIDKIMAIEAGWQDEARKKYPNILPGSQGIESAKDSMFTNYLKSELETYSDKTLESYYKDLEQALKDNRNISIEKYAIMFKHLGYNSLEEAESAMEK